MGIKKYKTPQQRYVAHAKSVKYYTVTKRLESLTRQLIEINPDGDVKSIVNRFFKLRKQYREDFQELMKLMYIHGIIIPEDEFDII